MKLKMLALWKKRYDQPRQHIEKQKQYFANKGPSSQSYGFSNNHVWLWELDHKESWALKNWCLELWYWILLRVPWTAQRSNQSILKEIGPEYTLERLMLKPMLQQFGHLMQRTDSMEKTLMLGKIEGRSRKGHRGWDGWIASPTQWTYVWVSSRSWWCTGKPGVLQLMMLQRVWHNWASKLIYCFSLNFFIFFSWSFFWTVAKYVSFLTGIIKRTI